MANARLLDSPKHSGDYSSDTTEQPDSLESEFILDDQETYKAKHGGFYRFTPAGNALFHSRRRRQWGIATLGVCFVVALIVIFLVLGHRGDDELRSRLGKDNLTHRRIACTNWPKDEVSLLDTEARTPPGANSSAVQQPSQQWAKPEGFKIVALVFYGRREYVDILDCYLRQNLASHGGYLDEVLFVENARDVKDVKWLDRVVETTDEYRKVEPPSRCSETTSWASCLWDLAAEPDTLYIKIDDDILYLHPDAIPSLVETRMRRRDAIVIAANMINIRFTAWPHYHNDAIHAYLPEPNVTEVQGGEITWRPSEMPDYPMPKEGEKRLQTFGRKDMVLKYKPPFAGHRWLKLTNSSIDIMKTPVWQLEANDIEVAKHWTLAAQQQYSFLENLERNDLSMYRVGDKDGVLDTQYRRYNINMLAIWGSDVAENLPFDPPDRQVAYDEWLLSVGLPRRLQRPFLVESRAIGVHFSFATSRRASTTDLLDRWRAYANENICHVQRKPFGRTCPGVA